MADDIGFWNWFKSKKDDKKEEKSESPQMKSVEESDMDMLNSMVGLGSADKKKKR